MSRRARSAGRGAAAAMSAEKLQRFLRPGALARLRDSKICARSPRSALKVAQIAAFRFSPPGSPAPGAVLAPPEGQQIRFFAARSCAPRHLQRKKLAAAKLDFYEVVLFIVMELEDDILMASSLDLIVEWGCFSLPFDEVIKVPQSSPYGFGIFHTHSCTRKAFQMSKEERLSLFLETWVSSFIASDMVSLDTTSILDLFELDSYIGKDLTGDMAMPTVRVNCFEIDSWGMIEDFFFLSFPKLRLSYFQFPFWFSEEHVRVNILVMTSCIAVLTHL